MAQALRPGGLYKTEAGDWVDANGKPVDGPSAPEKRAATEEQKAEEQAAQENAPEPKGKRK